MFVPETLGRTVGPAGTLLARQPFPGQVYQVIFDVCFDLGLCALKRVAAGDDHII
jgi:hypothetical protein